MRILAFLVQITPYIDYRKKIYENRIYSGVSILLNTKQMSELQIFACKKEIIICMKKTCISILCVCAECFLHLLLSLSCGFSATFKC